MVVCNLKGTKLLCLKSVIFGKKCIAFHYFWQIFTIKCIYLVRLIKICYFLVFTTFAYFFFKNESSAILRALKMSKFGENLTAKT